MCENAEDHKFIRAKTQMAKHEMRLIHMRHALKHGRRR